jgi:hypothetical protein
MTSLSAAIRDERVSLMEEDNATCLYVIGVEFVMIELFGSAVECPLSGSEDSKRLNFLCVT